MTDIKYTPEDIELLIEQNNDLKDEIRFLFDREEILLIKLNIALECICDYSNRSNWKTTESGDSCYFGTNGYELAEEALDKIKEVGTINEVKFKPFSERLLAEKISENEKLKDLLKEWVQFEIEENPNDFTVMSERMSELANKTKEVLK